VVIGLLTLCFVGCDKKDGGKEHRQSAPADGSAKTRSILKMSTTTSIEDSGLLDVLTSGFEKEYNCQVRAVAVGTGAAIKIAMNGDVDIVFVHAKDLEEKFVKDGFGTKRNIVMYNYFVVVGPPNDPAGTRGMKNAREAFSKIASNNSCFVSRGDKSGTEVKEKEIWSGIPEIYDKMKSTKNYILAGQEMAATLRIASEKSGYTLTDWPTFVTHKKEIKLEVMVEGDEVLYNPYTLIPVSPQKFPNVNLKFAQKFVDYCTKGNGANIIREYGKEKFGQPLYFLVK